MKKKNDTNGYKFLSILQDDQVRHREMKEKLEEEYLKREEKLAKSRPYSKNKIDRINVWAVGAIQYSTNIIDCSAGNAGYYKGWLYKHKK